MAFELWKREKTCFTADLRGGTRIKNQPHYGSLKGNRERLALNRSNPEGVKQSNPGA
jgi:hypothetical protein